MLNELLDFAVEGFCFAVCGDAQPLDDWFLKFKQEFNVKGGGRNGMVQGTALNTKEQILGVINELD